MDPLAFADNGAEWRLLQAYTMHAMFDDSGHLLPLWPELDHLLQLQAVGHHSPRKAFVVRAMFDDFGHLLRPWPELDHLLQLGS